MFCITLLLLSQAITMNAQSTSGLSTNLCVQGVTGWNQAMNGDYIKGDGLVNGKEYFTKTTNDIDVFMYSVNDKWYFIRNLALGTSPWINGGISSNHVLGWCKTASINSPKLCDSWWPDHLESANNLISDGLCGINIITPSPTSYQPTASTLAEQLVELINDYREENSLSRIPSSITLMKVGQAHIDNDFCAESIGDLGADSSCNFHSWYDCNNPYTSCCYTDDHAESECMWTKPSEFSSDFEGYQGRGYEISAFGRTSVERALSGWKSSWAHNDVILNKRIWSQYEWKSIGCGVDIDNEWFHCWFSLQQDPTPYVPN